jgi:hypothetical protein
MFDINYAQEKTNAMLNAIVEQRNAAQNQVADLAGRLQVQGILLDSCLSSTKKLQGFLKDKLLEVAERDAAMLEVLSKMEEEFQTVAGLTGAIQQAF